MTNSGSDAGTPAGDGTFGLRTGQAVVDQSRTMAAQFQYGFDLGSWQSLTYGVDWQRTEPRTGGTINGRNEDDDIISEIGATCTRRPRWETWWIWSRPSGSTITAGWAI